MCGNEETGEVLDKERARALRAVRDYDVWFRYAEEIGQHRLYNFLMSASILILACATLMVGDGPGKKYVVTTMCILGVWLGFLWTVLGMRQKKFHEAFESQLSLWLQKSGVIDYSIPAQILVGLKGDGLDLNDDSCRKKLELHWVEKHLGASRNFLILIPGVFVLVFLAVLATQWWPSGK